MFPRQKARRSPCEPTLQVCVLSSILACPGDASGSLLPSLRGQPSPTEANLRAMRSTRHPAAAPIPTWDRAGLCGRREEKR